MAKQKAATQKRTRCTVHTVNLQWSFKASRRQPQSLPFKRVVFAVTIHGFAFSSLYIYINIFPLRGTRNWKFGLLWFPFFCVSIYRYIYSALCVSFLLFGSSGAIELWNDRWRVVALEVGVFDLGFAVLVFCFCLWFLSSAWEMASFLGGFWFGFVVYLQLISFRLRKICFWFEFRDGFHYIVGIFP